MKIDQQFNEHRKALKKKAKMYGLIMLASGLALLVAAPLLSYKISSVKYIDKNTPTLEPGEEAIQSIEIKKIRSEISDLKIENQDLSNQINQFSFTQDCNVFLEPYIKEVGRIEKELYKIQNKNKDLTTQLNECKENLKNAAGEDCNSYINRINGLNKTITQLKNKLENCKAEKDDSFPTSITGFLRNNQSFVFNGDIFSYQHLQRANGEYNHIVTFNNNIIKSQHRFRQDGKNYLLNWSMKVNEATGIHELKFSIVSE